MDRRIHDIVEYRRAWGPPVDCTVVRMIQRRGHHIFQQNAANLTSPFRVFTCNDPFESFDAFKSQDNKMLEQLTKRCGRSWLVGNAHRSPKTVLRGHKSA